MTNFISKILSLVLVGSLFALAGCESGSRPSEISTASSQDTISGNQDGSSFAQPPNQSETGNESIPNLNDTASPTQPPDTDGDTFPDSSDNCPAKNNPDQTDSDGDGTGDVCDAVDNNDDDRDWIINAYDNCPVKANPDQTDSDGDGIGDVCDATPLPALPNLETLSVPGDLLDLSRWKLTLPTGQPRRPQEVKPPELTGFAVFPWFTLNSAKNAVVFRAPVGGVTTKGSRYPRSELREMTADGTNKASWSTTSGVHTMIIRQAIVATPRVKPHVVAGQIHDGDDDVVMIRLEGSRLFVEADGDEVGDLDSSYRLGTPFTVKIRASGGVISVYYQNMSIPKVTLKRKRQGCYFKAGVYTQSNPAKGDHPDDYGEVWIYDLQVSHS